MPPPTDDRKSAGLDEGREVEVALGVRDMASADRFEGMERVRLEVWEEVRGRWEEVRRAPGDDAMSVVELDGRVRLGSPWKSDAGPHTAEERWLRAHAVSELVHAGMLRQSLSNERVYVVTPHGARCLAKNDPGFPLDITGRVEALRSEFPGAPDLDLLCRYLSEAIEAYRHNLTLAAATMIGCAYELALVQLATAVVKKWPPGTIATVTGRLRDAAQRHANGEYAAAGLLADVVYKSLEANSGLLGDEWRWVASCFNPTFFIVRELRNDAGHPSGKAVARDEVFTHMVNLGPTYRHVRAIVAKL